MVQSNQAVWGTMDREVRSYKGPPSLAITEHWNYEDKGKDFFGGYCYMSQGPLPQHVGRHPDERPRPLGTAPDRGNGEVQSRRRSQDRRRNVAAGGNRVTLADETDQYGLRIPRITYSWCDNDRRLIDHSLAFMTQALEAVDASDIWRQNDDTCHLNGTARMGDDPLTSVVDADCRSWDIRNLWICDGSVFPTVGGVNPSLTIQAIACRTADRIKTMAGRGEL